MPTVLVTGFGPFGKTAINPAERVVRAVDGRTIAGATVVGRVVPNTFARSIEAVKDAIAEVGPVAVIMMGEYGGRAMITVERIAQNLIDAPRYQLADNDGAAPQDQPVVPGGPAAYYSTLPIRAVVKAIRRAGVPADISDTAATFGCNHLMYGILHHVAASGLPLRAGWIHLPFLPGTAAREDNLGAPSMSAETSTIGVEAAIRAVLENERDIPDVIPSRFQI